MNIVDVYSQANAHIQCLHIPPQSPLSPYLRMAASSCLQVMMPAYAFGHLKSGVVCRRLPAIGFCEGRVSAPWFGVKMDGGL